VGGGVGEGGYCPTAYTARNLMASFFWKVYLIHVIHTEYIIFMKKTIKLSILNMQREESIVLNNLSYL
jgi:hypothetical protein